MRYARLLLLERFLSSFLRDCMSKAQKTTLTLCLLQQQAHMTSHVKGEAL